MLHNYVGCQTTELLIISLISFALIICCYLVRFGDWFSPLVSFSQEGTVMWYHHKCLPRL